MLISNWICGIPHEETGMARYRQPDKTARVIGAGAGGLVGGVIGALVAGLPGAVLGAAVATWIGHKAAEEASKNGL